MTNRDLTREGTMDRHGSFEFLLAKGIASLWPTKNQTRLATPARCIEGVGPPALTIG